ncbi:MAG: EamA family transporter [Nitrospinota bacterium]|nr:EamA family transporter [Nitrospinota bacterium]
MTVSIGPNLMALQGGKVTRVVPIQRLSMLYIIFLSWIFFRKDEAISARVVLGGLLAVAGAWAIVWDR